MKRILALAIIVLSVSGAYGQEKEVYDTLYTAGLREVTVKARWKNDTERYKYNQMKHYVKTILPYLNAGTALFKEMDQKSREANLSHRQWKQYVNGKEDQMRTQFEDKVKSLNVTQGLLLVKLLTRQTNLNIYKELQEFKNPLTAVKWQTWAKINGMNLNRKYNPEDEPDLENIMYELGYPLPEGYAVR